MANYKLLLGVLLSIALQLKLSSNMLSSPKPSNFSKNLPHHGRDYVIIVLPYRSREMHLRRFIHYMDDYMYRTKQTCNFVYWVVEQDDKQAFNRGWLTNVGIHTAIKYFKHRKTEIKCIVQHDVDRYPVGYVNYSDCGHLPTQFSSENKQWNGTVPYTTYAGGVIAMKPLHWYAVNGMSNMYEGWGGEDDDLYIRLRAKNLLQNGTYGPIRRPGIGYGAFHEWHDDFHTKRDMSKHVRTGNRLSMMQRGQAIWRNDGLSNLIYRVTRKTGGNTKHSRYHHFFVRKERTPEATDLLYAALGGAYAKKAKSVEDLVYSVRAVSGNNVTIKVFVKRKVKSQSMLDLGQRMSLQFVICPGLSKPYAYTRFTCYLREMQKEHQDSKVALLDSSDVVFFRNIYNKIRAGVYLVQEPKAFPISKCPHHKKWIAGCKAYGPSVFERVKNNAMICAGTIFGKIGALTNLIKSLDKEIRSSRCNDQGLLNVLIYDNKWQGNYTLWTYEDGPVKSMNVAKTHDINDPDLFVAHTGDNKKAVATVDKRPEKYFRNVLSVEDEKRSLKLLQRIDQLLVKSNTTYVIDGGTLVGAVQIGHRIPWDDDMDLYIMEADLEKVIEVLSVDGLYTLPSYNNLYYKVWDPRNPKVQNGQAHGWPFVDIGILQSNITHAWEKRVSESKYSHHIYRLDWLLPTRRMKYSNFFVSVPRNTSAFLEHRFGKKWEKRCVYANWDHKYERIRYKSLGNGDVRVSLPCVDLKWALA